jgi:hypothetical protein
MDQMAKAQAAINNITQQVARMNGIPGVDMPKDVLEALGDITLTTKASSKERAQKMTNFFLYQAYKSGGKDAMLAMQDIIKQAIPNT